MSKVKPALYALTDHACRERGGRILMQTSGHGPTGGGNPIFRCADCEKGVAAMDASCLCWCGFSYRGQIDHPFRCMPFKGNEHLYLEFAKCGCYANGKAVIGIILSSVDTRKPDEKS